MLGTSPNDLACVLLLLKLLQVNVAVMLALDPRVIIAAVEEDMGEGMRREVSTYAQQRCILTIIRFPVQVS